MKLKKLVLALLVITLLMPVSYAPNKTKADATFSIKGYRHSHAALIEWTKVPGATNYKIYRATRKKGKKTKYTKFKELKIKKGENKLTENWFTKYGDNILNTRWFVNVDTDGFEKTQKKYLYNHKKTYKYKVKAFDNNKKCIAVSNTIRVKKYKSRMYEPRYENLYYVNKARYKNKLNVIPWGHQYNKGLKGRAKDVYVWIKKGVDFKAKKNGKYIYHTRPNGKRRDSLFQYLRLIDENNLSIYNPRLINENLGKNTEYAKEMINGYLESPGHRRVVLLKTSSAGCYCAYLLKTRKAFYDVMSVLHYSLVISRDAGKTYNVPRSFYKALSASTKKYINNFMQKKELLTTDTFWSDISFHSSFYNKMKSKYIFINQALKDKYFNSENDKIYTYYPGWGYDISENDTAQVDKEILLFQNFLNDYVNALPYK